MKHPEFFEELVEVGNEAMARLNVHIPDGVFTEERQIQVQVEEDKAKATIVAAIVEGYAYRRLIGMSTLLGVMDDADDADDTPLDC